MTTHRPALLTDPAPEAAETEIEVTPAMLRAGVRVLYGYETETAGEGYWAERIYRAMASASLAGLSASNSQGGN
jgi:hypothetical protein